MSKLTGLDTSTVRGIYGPFATPVWISLAETLEKADAGMSGDPTHFERIDEGGELFLPGSASQQLIRRLA